MDAGLLALLGAQDGVCSAGQAQAFGVAHGAITAAVKAGELIRVRRAAYVDAAAFRAAEPDRRYALRVRATLASRPPLDAASHHAALVLHGMPVFGFDLTRIDLVADVDHSSSAGRVLVHPRNNLQTIDVGGALATDLATSLVRATTTTGIVPGVVCADHALASGRCTLAQLREAAEAALPVKAHVRLRRLLELVDPRSESVAESRARLLFVGVGLPVRSQVTITDDQGYFVGRVDLLVGERVVVEVDGAAKYANDPDGFSLFREKIREDRLRELGYEVVRVTWAELANPAKLLARLRAALARAEGRRN